MHGAHDANVDVLYVDMYRDKHPGDWHGTLCLLRGHLYWLRCCRAWSHNLLQWLGVHLPRERQYNNTTPSFRKIYCMEQLSPHPAKNLAWSGFTEGGKAWRAPDKERTGEELRECLAGVQVSCKVAFSPASYPQACQGRQPLVDVGQNDRYN